MRRQIRDAQRRRYRNFYLFIYLFFLTFVEMRRQTRDAQRRRSIPRTNLRFQFFFEIPDSGLSFGNFFKIFFFNFIFYFFEVPDSGFISVFNFADSQFPNSADIPDSIFPQRIFGLIFFFSCFYLLTGGTT